MMGAVTRAGVALAVGWLGGGKAYDQYRPPPCALPQCTTSELAADRRSRLVTQAAVGAGVFVLLSLFKK